MHDQIHLRRPHKNRIEVNASQVLIGGVMQNAGGFDNSFAFIIRLLGTLDGVQMFTPDIHHGYKKTSCAASGISDS